MDTLFFRNRRLLILTICLIFVAGVSSFLILPRMEDPVLTDRAAVISTRLSGANAQRVESLVTDHIVRGLQEIEEVKEIRSFSRPSVSTVSVELRDDVVGADQAWSRVRDKLDDVKSAIDPAAEDPDFEINEIRAFTQILAIVWDREDEAVNYAILSRFAEQLEDLLRAVPGTDDVEMFGLPQEEIVAEVSKSELTRLGLSVPGLAQRIAASDSKVAVGLLRDRQTELLLEVAGDFDSLSRVARTPVQYGDAGASVMLGDIAQLRKGVADPAKSLAIVGGKPAILLASAVRADYRVDHWATANTAAYQQFAGLLPESIAVESVFEQNRYVGIRLQELMLNLAYAALAVMVVILVMIGLQGAWVVAMTLLLSTLMVVAGFRVLGVPIHQMSLTGLIISLGLLIDNAIIVVHDVRHRREGGTEPLQAVSASVRQLAIPLLGSTFTTVLTFAPIALMSGGTGEFIGTVAVSVILAIGSSLALALTIVPALAAMDSGILPGEVVDHDGGRKTWWRNGIQSRGMSTRYRGLLVGLLRRPILAMLIAMVLPVIGFIVAPTLREQYFPPAERDQFQIEIELPTQSSLRDTAAVTKQARELVLAKNATVRRIDWVIGESFPSFYYNMMATRKDSANYAQALVQCDDAEQAQLLIRTVQQQLNQALPQAQCRVRQLEQGPPFNAPVEIRIFGPARERLWQVGEEIRRLVSSHPEVSHTRADLTSTAPKVVFQVDEDRARLVGLPLAAIASQLNGTLEGTMAGSMMESSEVIPVRIRLSNQERGDFDNVSTLDLITRSATKEFRTTPLSALGHVDLIPGEATIAKMSGRTINEVQVFLNPGILPSEVVKWFQRKLPAELLPPGYTIEFGGEASRRSDAVGELMATVGVVATLVVAALVLAFRSFRCAALIGLVAGLSAGLGVLSVWIFDFPFGFTTIIAIMGLIGVAINDSIVVLADIRDDPAARSGNVDAVASVVLQSTRHVLATTFTTIAGFLPLILAGGEFWPPLAVVISGGVLGATLLALCLVPAAHVLLSTMFQPRQSHAVA